MLVSPYTRIDVVRVDLDRYNENGSPTWNLSYNTMTATTVSAVLGTRVAYPIPEAWGTLSPTARFEYNHALSGAFNQTLSYAELPGTNYIISGTSQASNLVSAGLGLRADTTGGFGAELEYLLSGTSKAVQGQQIRARVKQAF